MSDIDEGLLIPKNTVVPPHAIKPSTEYAWISSLSDIDSDNIDKVLKIIEKDISLKEQAMQNEVLLDEKRMDEEKSLKEKEMNIEEKQLDREDYFNRWGLILSFGIVFISIVIGGILISDGHTYGGGVVIVIGAGLGSGSISKIAEKLMGKVFK